MIKYIILILLLLTSCAHNKDLGWSNIDKTLLATSVLATAADAYTTINMLENPNNYEVNPLMGKHPSNSQVIITMAITEILFIIVVHYFKDYRKFILGSKIVVNTGCALHNKGLE